MRIAALLRTLTPLELCHRRFSSPRQFLRPRRSPSPDRPGRTRGGVEFASLCQVYRPFAIDDSSVHSPPSALREPFGLRTPAHVLHSVDLLPHLRTGHFCLGRALHCHIQSRSDLPGEDFPRPHGHISVRFEFSRPRFPPVLERRHAGKLTTAVPCSALRVAARGNGNGNRRSAGPQALRRLFQMNLRPVM